MEKGFALVHPVVCFIYYSLSIIFAMTLFHPIYLIPAFMIAIVFQQLHDGGKTLAKVWRFYLLMGLAVAMINPLVCHRGRKILFYFLNKPITLESVIYGITMMLSLWTILVTFLSYQQVINNHKFMYLFSAFLPKTTFLMMMAMRFISLLKIRLEQLSIVQKTKGIDRTKGSIRKRIEDGMNLLYILVTWSLEEALQTAESMKSRGYGLSKRTSFFDYKMGKWNWVLLIIILMLAVVTMIGRYLGYGILTIYPTLASVSFAPQSLLFFITFCVFLLIPIFEEGKDRWLWRSLK
jgi:energy-coupling factor transport system permease protein